MHGVIFMPTATWISWVDFDDGADLFDLVGLQQFLEEKLSCKVDLVSRRSLREELRTSVLNEMIDYERLTGVAFFQ